MVLKGNQVFLLNSLALMTRMPMTTRVRISPVVMVKRAVSCRRSCLIMGPSDFQAVSDSVDRLNLGQGSYGFETTSQKIDIVVQIPLLHI